MNPTNWQRLKDFTVGLQRGSPYGSGYFQMVLDKMAELENKCRGCGCQGCKSFGKCRWCQECLAGNDWYDNVKFDCWKGGEMDAQKDLS